MRSLTGYGADHEHVITHRKARFLLKGTPIPEPGGSVDLATGTHDMVFTYLYLRNVLGLLVLVSVYTPRKYWETVFSIKL